MKILRFFLIAVIFFTFSVLKADELDKRNNNHGMIADSELEPLAKLSNYDNDNLTGNEFVFETISGV